MDMKMPNGIPWLMYPLTFHSSREYTCTWNSTELCDWNFGYWRNWYYDDLRYAIPTVAFFMAVILLFVLGNITNKFMPRTLWQSKPIRQFTGLNRYLSYRAFRVPQLNWNSAPLGVLLLGAIGAIYFFSMTLGPKPYYWPNTKTMNFGDSPAIATRSGWLSIGCMPFVFATAGKSNFITAVTGVSHEKLQVFHRWISYAFLVTALVHTFPFIVYHIKVGDMVMQWKTSSFYWTGVAAIVSQAYLTFASFSPLRNLSYEFFKISHFLAALCFMVFFFLHCDGTLTSWDYFVVTGVLFSLSWLHRQIRIYFEHRVGHKAKLNLEPNGFIRVVIPTKAHWRAGQHFFVRFLSLGLHVSTIHPFTACSLPLRSSIYESKESNLVFYIRPQKGFTGRLARYVDAHPNCTMRVLLDGPYGGIDMNKIEHSHRQVVIAGGSGAGWILPMIAAYLRKLQFSETVETGRQPSLRVVLATREITTRHWFEEKVGELLEAAGMSKSPSGLELELFWTGWEGEDKSETLRLESERFPEKIEAAAEKAFVLSNTKEKKELESDSDSSSDIRSTLKSVDLQYREGRPNLPAIIRGEAQSTDSDKPLGVFLCGPLSMQNDVGNAVAEEQIGIMRSGRKEVYLHMEHFSWA